MHKCPFPGMDPFIESDNWQHFHVALTVEIARQLGPQLPSHYRVSAELLVQEAPEAETSDPGRSGTYRPDVGVYADRSVGGEATDTGTATATLTAPTREMQADPAPRQRELRIRDTRNNRLVSAIEVLSPSNKRGEGWMWHRRKVERYQRGGVNVLDINLLRGGDYSLGVQDELHLAEDGPRETYCVALFVPNGGIKVWDIGLADTLPTVPVPLSYPDAPVVLNLQRAFDELYAYSTYPVRRATDLPRVWPPLTEVEHGVLAGFL